MSDFERELAARVRTLEVRLRTAILVAAGLAVIVMVERETRAYASDDEAPEIKVSKITVVDEKGRPRLILGSDPSSAGRISKIAGLFVFDDTGAERGGFGTMEDGSVVLALDAPVGVGSPMRDRIALKVYKTGAAYISLINNKTGIPVRLISDADGGGGVEFLEYDLKARKALIKRLSYSGETRTERSLD